MFVEDRTFKNYVLLNFDKIEMMVCRIEETDPLPNGVKKL